MAWTRAILNHGEHIRQLMLNALARTSFAGSTLHADLVKSTVPTTTVTNPGGAYAIMKSGCAGDGDPWLELTALYTETTTNYKGGNRYSSQWLSMVHPLSIAAQ